MKKYQLDREMEDYKRALRVEEELAECELQRVQAQCDYTNLVGFKTWHENLVARQLLIQTLDKKGGEYRTLAGKIANPPRKPDSSPPSLPKFAARASISAPATMYLPQGFAEEVLTPVRQNEPGPPSKPSGKAKSAGKSRKKETNTDATLAYVSGRQEQ